MTRTHATAYFMWTLIVLFVGFYVIRSITDESNPSSFNSSVKKLKEAVDDENSKISE